MCHGNGGGNKAVGRAEDSGEVPGPLSTVKMVETLAPRRDSEDIDMTASASGAKRGDCGRFGMLLHKHRLAD